MLDFQPATFPPTRTIHRHNACGLRLIRAGAFDYDAFVRIHDEDGALLIEQQRKILREGSDTQVVIDRAGSPPLRFM